MFISNTVTVSFFGATTGENCLATSQSADYLSPFLASAAKIVVRDVRRNVPAVAATAALSCQVMFADTPRGMLPQDHIVKAGSRGSLQANDALFFAPPVN